MTKKKTTKKTAKKTGAKKIAPKDKPRKTKDPKTTSKRRKMLSEAEKVKAQYGKEKLVGRPLGYSKRPKTQEDFELFEDLCKIHCTVEEIMSIFDCARQTLYDHVREYYQQDFPIVLAQKREPGKIALRRAQMQLALKGNPTMQIWLGKNWLGQSDVIIKGDDEKFIAYQTRIGPNGTIIQEIKSSEDWDKSKTFDVRDMLSEAKTIDLEDNEDEPKE